MVEEPIAFHRALAASSAREQTQKPQTQTFALTRFDRLELNRILAIYGRMVAAGEWRDYALDFLDDVAVFSIFRRSSEMALFQVEKRPRLKSKQGQYAVVATGGQVLRRGHELAQVLKIFDKKLLKALAAE